VTRYQQFRAVHAAIRRLHSGKTRTQHGESDQRGGIIWHTQGSGKSPTTVFLVRQMRMPPELRWFKVVVVTDRTDLGVEGGVYGGRGADASIVANFTICLCFPGNSQPRSRQPAGSSGLPRRPLPGMRGQGQPRPGNPSGSPSRPSPVVAPSCSLCKARPAAPTPRRTPL
jgi:hypothetical protein